MKLDRRQGFRKSSPRRNRPVSRLAVELLEERNAPDLWALLFAPPAMLDFSVTEEVPSSSLRRPAEAEMVALPSEAREEPAPANVLTSPGDARASAVFAEPSQTPDIAAVVAVASGQRDPLLASSPNGPRSADPLVELSDELSLTTDAGQVTLEAFGHSLHNVRGFAAPANAGASLPYGLFSFEIGNVTPGGSATVRMVLPEGAAPSAYFKQDIGGHLSRFDFDGTTGAQIAGNVVTLHYVDGGRGDEDGLANGVIVDPGGPWGGGGGFGADSLNNPPVAVGDYDPTTDEDVPFDIDVLANDYDPDGDPITIVNVTGASHGTLEYDEALVTYTPDPDWWGQEHLTYTITDGNGDYADGEITVTVVWVNDAPDAVADSVGALEDTSVTFNVLANDLDADDDPLWLWECSDPQHGIVGYLGDGNLFYTPNGDFNGTDQFAYTVWDGIATSSAATITVTVTPVNDVPISYHDAFAFDLQEGMNTTFQVGAPGLLRNDADYDFWDIGYDPYTLVVTGADTTGMQGQLVLYSNGSFQYTPPSGLTAGTVLIDTFLYTSSDGFAASNTATVWLFTRVFEQLPGPGGPPPPPPPQAVPDEFFVGDAEVSGNVALNDVGAYVEILVTPPAYGRLLPFEASGVFTYYPDPTRSGEVPGVLRTEGGIAWSNTLAYDAFASNGGAARTMLQVKQPRPWFMISTHNFAAPFNGYRHLDSVFRENPGAYVHWNIDNDNGNSTGDASAPSIADYTETGPVATEDDLMPLRVTLSGGVPDKGVVTLSRQNANLRVWGTKTKGAGTEVLVSVNSKTWNLANAAERADFETLFGSTPEQAKLWVEGYGDGKAGQLSSELTLTYTPPQGQGTATSRKVKYTFFAAPGKRQPTPAERTWFKQYWPRLIDCEWGITDEPTMEPGVPANAAYPGSPAHDPMDWANRWYNCFAWSVGETNLYWDPDDEIPALKMKSIDKHYGQPFINGQPTQDFIFQRADLDKFYEVLQNIRPTKKIPAFDVATVMVYENHFQGGYIIEHSAKRIEPIADGQLIMYESKLGQFHRIEHVWSHLISDEYGFPHRFYGP